MLNAFLADKIEVSGLYKKGKHLVLKRSTQPNAGNGIFAKKKFKKGDIVTKYKGELIYSSEEDNSPLDDYRLKVTDKLVMVGDADSPFDPMGCAQYVNDYAAFGVTREELSRPMEDLLQRMGKYLHTSTKCNCIITRDKGDNIPHLMILKTVKAGEELFLHYGLSYWVERWKYTLKESDDTVGTFSLAEIDRIYKRCEAMEAHVFRNNMKRLGWQL